MRDPWAALLLVSHTWFLHAAFSNLDPTEEDGNEGISQTGGEEMPRAPTHTRSLGDYLQLKLSVVPRCSQLIRSTQLLPCEPSADELLSKQHFFLLLLMRSLEFCNFCNFFGDVLQINNLF